MGSRLTRLALIALISVMAAACGGGSGTDTESEAGGGAASEEDTAAAGGSGGGEAADFLVTGSSTVEPISSLNAELYAEENADAPRITVEGPGTGDGFELFCSGEAAIADASRPIDEEEAAACEEAGVEFVEIQVAIDGIAVLTSAANTAVTCLDSPALYALMGPEAIAENWADAAPLATELGSEYADALPAQPLQITAPGQESGTYDSFVDLSGIADLAEERGQPEDAGLRDDYTASPNDNVIIEGIGGSQSSLGFVGFAFAENAGDTVTELEIAGEDGTCVAPTAETIADGSYPLARPLFIYVSLQAAEENPAVAGYVDYYLSEDGLLSVEEAGYVLPPDDVVSDSQSRWESRETGSA